MCRFQSIVEKPLSPSPAPASSPALEPNPAIIADAVAELLTMASASVDPAALSLLDLSKQGPDGQERLSRFCMEVMRAFGVCAHGLAADIPVQSKGLARIVDGHPGLKWALSTYRQNVDVAELNELLLSNPQQHARAQERLGEWLKRAQR